MKNFTYNKHEVELLRSLLRKHIECVVWDTNAFYFNTEDQTIKLECVSDIPEGASDQYDEIFYTKVLKLKEKLTFVESPKYSFKIVAREVRILKFEMLQALIKFPEDNVIGYEENTDVVGYNNVCLGLLVNLRNGVLPAYILMNSFGFYWLEEQRLYVSEELKIDPKVRKIVIQ